MKIKILHDVYNIVKRIKNIEKNYFVIYDTKKCKFEIHNSNQIGGTYCLTLPFDYLDERALNYTLKTQRKNIEKILYEIDNQNKLKESAEKSRALALVCESMEREERK